MASIINVAGLSQALGVQPVAGGSLTGATPVGGDRLRLSRADPRHFAAGGGTPPLGEEGPASFESAMLKALDGVNASQLDSSAKIEAMIVDPDSVDAHDVTISMAKASMSLNITRTVLDRVVRAWKDIINTR